MTNRHRAAGRAACALRRCGSAIAIAAAASACGAVDRLLSVEPRSRVPAGTIENPANAQLLLNGVIADFECAFGAYTVLGGLVGEELDDATQTADRHPYDRRTHTAADRRYSVNACETLGAYTPLQTARNSAENLLAFLQVWTDAEVANRTSMVATASAYAGYSYVLLGEGFCTMALSGLDQNRQPVYGDEIQRDSVFRIADAMFTRAIEAAQASGNTDILNMALVGRARARQNLNRLADARADATRVPANYVKNATASGTTTRRENRIWAQNSSASTSTSVGLPYRGLNDSRVPTTNLNRSTVTGVPLWRQEKYLAAATPIPIATYDEAQLIVAEAEIAAGNLPAAVTIINFFRTRAGQSAFSSGDPAEVRAELIEQRRRELYLEGQHLGDVIRYGLTLRPLTGASYPAGGTYGTQLCLPLPLIERQNNPRLRG